MAMFLVSVIIRAFEFFCILVATACVGIGKGLCNEQPLFVNPDGSTNKCNSEWKCPIGYWNKGSSYLYGQYFVFVSALLLTLVTFVSIVLAILGPQYGMIDTASFGSFTCLVNGGLEVWYTVAGGSYCKSSSGTYDSGYHVMSWAAASAFFFMLFVFYLIDSLIERRMYRNPAYGGGPSMYA